jgi:hypothetical protein
MGAMNYRKPIAVTLASAFAVNCVGAGLGVQLFTDLPPLAAFAVGSTASNFTGSAFLPVYATPTYNAVTDELRSSRTKQRNPRSAWPDP